MKVVVYHKIDADGCCSGAIIKRYFKNVNEEIMMIPMNYGDPFPVERISKDDIVYFVDFTLQPYANMIDFIDSHPSTIVLDHHKTAIDALANVRVKGLLDKTLSGCELTWRWFYPNTEIPTFVSLLGRYDRWDKTDEKAWAGAILPFQKYIQSYDIDPITNYPLWESLFNDTENATLNDKLFDGRAIIRYQEMQDSKLMENSYVVEWEGYRCLVFNGHGNSNNFEKVFDPEKHDIMILYKDIRGTYTVSIYTNNDIDGSVISKKYGGGGHKQASGFQCEILPWRVK